MPPSSADFYFNGFTKKFLTSQDKTSNTPIPFPKNGDDLNIFLKSTNGFQFKKIILTYLKKIKTSVFKHSLDGKHLFEKFVNSQATANQAYLEDLYFFVGILELAQNERIEKDRRKNAIEVLFSEKAYRKQIYFYLMGPIVEHSIQTLMIWADKHKILYDKTRLFSLIGKINEEILYRLDPALLISETKLLIYISSLAENNNIPPTKKFLISHLLEHLGLHGARDDHEYLQETQFQLDNNTAAEFTCYRASLVRDIAYDILIKHYPIDMNIHGDRLNVHMANALINFNAEKLGLPTVLDDLAQAYVSKISRIQGDFITRLKEKLTPKNLIEKTSQQLEESLCNCVKLLNETTSEKDKEEILKEISILFNAYGEDKKTFTERPLFSFIYREKSDSSEEPEHIRYDLAHDIQETLIITLTRRLIHAGYLEEKEIQSFEYEKGIFYCLRSFPEKSFFISKSNKKSNLLDAVSNLIEERNIIPHTIIKIFLKAFFMFAEDFNSFFYLKSASLSFIANYLSLLDKLVDKLETGEKKELLKMLQNTRALGVMMASHQDGRMIASYLSLLDKLIEGPQSVEKEELLKILKQQNEHEWNLGMIILQNQNDQTTTDYLSWLIKLIETQAIEKKDLLKILNHQVQNKWTLGTMIHYQDTKNKSNIMASYLSLLDKLIEEPEEIEKEDLLKTLNNEDLDGWTLSMMIASTQDAETTSAYLFYLNKLIEAHILEKKDLLKILNHQELNGWTLSMMIARHQNSTVMKQYLKLLEMWIDKENLDPAQLTKITMQKNTKNRSVETYIAHHQDKATGQQYQSLKKLTPFFKKIKEISALLEPLEFDKALEKLKNLLLTKDCELTDSHKSYLNEKVKNLIAVLNIKTSYRKREKESLEFLKNQPCDSLFYTATLIAQLEFETLDAATLDTLSSKLDKLPKTHFNYAEGQLALANYYVNFLKTGTPSELLAFLIHAERCPPPHAMLDRGYDSLGSFFPAENNSNIKIILKKLLLLVSDNPFALKRLEGILNFHNEDALLDFYLERVLFHTSETEKYSKNISNFFKLVTLPLHSTNKSRKIKITPEQCQELENLSSLNKPYNKSVSTLIDEFNKGNITEEILLTKLCNSIKEKNIGCLFLEKEKINISP